MSTEDKDQGTQPHPNPRVLWRHRARLAYGAFAALVALGAGCLVAPAEQVQAAQPVLIAIAWVLAATILAFVAADAWEELAKIKAGVQ